VWRGNFFFFFFFSPKPGTAVAAPAATRVTPLIRWVKGMQRKKGKWGVAGVLYVATKTEETFF
jgi:hypothetical protein